MADNVKRRVIQLPPAISRAEWHDKAWALYHSKTFEDTQLAKVNIHTIRAVFDATYDALLVTHNGGGQPAAR
jgi:hypothetical protein